MKETSPISPQMFYILLSLYQKDRHGYEIMKQVEIDTDSSIKLGPGTLYGIIKRLLIDELIRATSEQADSDSDDERRKYYTLTDKGRNVLGTEVRRLKQAVHRATELGVNIQTAGLKWGN